MMIEVKPYKKLIMLVDDNETDNFIHRRVLEMGHFSEEIIVKNSGKSALEYLEANKNNPDRIPEVIFLDINMPIVDGFVFLFEFESFPDSIKDNSKIIVLSSSDNKKDIDRIVDNDHVIHFITKPLSEDSVTELREMV
ncbi:response regulator [uncultured Cytophaga sp.]|uniref:response regulator n=1 Tax=uncultured Cytophaga sp. TaxID=160238 RepID=UPI00262383E1|nr:response regulator [uncultured Cytophaga sp.]